MEAQSPATPHSVPHTVSPHRLRPRPPSAPHTGPPHRSWRALPCLPEPSVSLEWHLCAPQTRRPLPAAQSATPPSSLPLTVTISSRVPSTLGLTSRFPILAAHGTSRGDFLEDPTAQTGLAALTVRATRVCRLRVPKFLRIPRWGQRALSHAGGPCAADPAPAGSCAHREPPARARPRPLRFN